MPNINFNMIEETPLDVQFKRFWETETFGTEGKERNEPILSQKDKLALEIVRQGTRALDIGYEVPLPWKPNEPALLNNRPMAEQRIKYLQRKFDRSPEYKAEYQNAINAYVDDGYAHRVTNTEELNATGQWYLPHHGVYKKSEKKLRIVFDSTAEYRGKSLNTSLFKGPTLQKELPGVLLRFRQKRVAVGADIKAMFSRIRPTHRDARYHRFLVKHDDEEEYVTYQMHRLTFGDGPSPFIAISTMHRTAEDHGNEREKAIKAIKEKNYVDDYLNSFDNEEEAIEISKQVKEILKMGDFHLVKWVYNFSEIRRAFGDSEAQVAHKNLAKVLGVGWNLEKDVFGYNVEIPILKEYRRRSLLSQLSSLFDPLVLAAPVILKAKIKMQHLTIRGIGWDEEITTEEKVCWQKWFKKVLNLGKLEIPRCLKPAHDLQSELHVFCDASEEAFAAVACIRNTRNKEYVSSNIILSKTRVEPKKTVSVAKLELQGALLGSRIAATIEKELNITFNRRIFWTDSACVRNWIRTTASYYKHYVSHRIGEIQTLTTPQEWRYAPGAMNSSDLATRSGLNTGDVISNSWIECPAFLKLPENQWPIDTPWIKVTEEIRIVEEKKLVNQLITEEIEDNWKGLKIKL